MHVHEDVIVRPVADSRLSLFLCALVVTMFVGSVWLFNVPWWLALLLAGVSVMVVAGLRFLFLSWQQGV